MYYVSQASFYPNPPAWGLSPDDKLVPPAEPLAYSQIPFYLTGLVDTPATMDAIRVGVFEFFVRIEGLFTWFLLFYVQYFVWGGGCLLSLELCLAKSHRLISK